MGTYDGASFGCCVGEVIGMSKLGGNDGCPDCIVSKVGYSVGEVSRDGILERVGLKEVEGTLVVDGIPVSSLLGATVDGLFGVSLRDCGTADGTMDGIDESRQDFFLLRFPHIFGSLSRLIPLIII